MATQTLVIFTPKIGEMIPNLIWAYFSNGFRKPPPRLLLFGRSLKYHEKLWQILFLLYGLISFRKPPTRLIEVVFLFWWETEVPCQCLKLRFSWGDLHPLQPRGYVLFALLRVKQERWSFVMESLCAFHTLQKDQLNIARHGKSTSFSR